MCSFQNRVNKNLCIFYYLTLHISVSSTYLALVRDLPDATDLLACLNEAHPSIQFTMEIATNDRLPFIGMEIIKIDGSLEPASTERKQIKVSSCTTKAMLTADTNGHC